MINYIVGDATIPKVSGNKIICHICNDVGAWGKGFVLSLSKQYPKTEEAYRLWSKQKDPYSEKNFELGEVQFVKCGSDLVVANMIAQKGIKSNNNSIPPIRYEALRSCLKTVSYNAPKINASIHMPRIGCGLAGGKWEIIEKIIIEEMIQDKNLDVYVYDVKKT